jgi:hypothetical protein
VTDERVIGLVVEQAALRLENQFRNIDALDVKALGVLVGFASGYLPCRCVRRRIAEIELLHMDQASQTPKPTPAPKIPAPAVPHVYVEKGVGGGSTQKRG